MRHELGIARDDGGTADIAGPLTQNALHEFGSDCEVVSYSLQASVTRQRGPPRSVLYAARIAAEERAATAEDEPARRAVEAERTAGEEEEPRIVEAEHAAAEAEVRALPAAQSCRSGTA